MIVPRTTVEANASKTAGMSFSSGFSGKEDVKRVMILHPKLFGDLKYAARILSAKMANS